MTQLPKGKSVHPFAAFEYDTAKHLSVWTFLPDEVSSASKVLIVMHGMLRNAEDYLDAWIDYGIKSNTIIIAPEFKREMKDQSHDYNEGNIKDPTKGFNKKELWSFNVIENSFNQIKETLQLSTETYSIFGHSAGAQFVHRMVLFFPEAKIKNAFAANAGWYTFTDFEEPFPYGLGQSPASEQSLRTSFQINLFIVLGAKDIETNEPSLRQTEQAKRQGINRFERGINFFEKAKKYARSKNVPSNWRLITLRNAEHDYIEVTKQVSKFLLKKQE